MLLTTKLDAASHFSVVASNPGSAAAVEIQVSFAPVLRDGTTGSWEVATTVALPAEGGRVEALISGRDIQLNAADLAEVDLPAACFAKAEVSPETPAPSARKNDASPTRPVPPTRGLDGAGQGVVTARRSTLIRVGE